MSTTGERPSTESGAPDGSDHFGTRALLEVSSADGRIWSCGALLTDLVARDGHEEQRAIEPNEELRLRKIEVVIL